MGSSPLPNPKNQTAPSNEEHLITILNKYAVIFKGVSRLATIDGCRETPFVKLLYSNNLLDAAAIPGSCEP